MVFPLCGPGAPENGCRSAAAEPISAMRSVPVVEHEESVQRPLQRPCRREVVSSKLDPPVFMEDRPLQAFHEPVGPRMPRLRPRVSDLAGRTGGDEARLELLPVVGQPAAQGQPAAR